jgi:UDP-glucose 4-epimerase
MDLADGHILALDALERSHNAGGIFDAVDVKDQGRYRAFNLGRGQGLSVMDMVEAMRKASNFDYTYQLVPRR